MAHTFNSRWPFRLSSRKTSMILFCFVWIAGLLCGSIIAAQVSDTYLLLMRRAASSPVSITDLLAAVLLPFLFIALSVYISRPKLIYLICFMKACTFMITGFSVIAAFGSAGWLVRLLLQFTDQAALGLFCWFAYRHLDGSKDRLWPHTAACGACIIGLGWIDYCYVSPFLALLIENSQTGR